MLRWLKAKATAVKHGCLFKVSHRYLCLFHPKYSTVVTISWLQTSPTSEMPVQMVTPLLSIHAWRLLTLMLISPNVGAQRHLIYVCDGYSDSMKQLFIAAGESSEAVQALLSPEQQSQELWKSQRTQSVIQQEQAFKQMVFHQLLLTN